MASYENAQWREVETVTENIPMILGADIVVTARGGRLVRGRCTKAWPLRAGGLALTVQPVDGSGLKHMSSTVPVVVYPASALDSPGLGSRPQSVS